MEEWKPTWRIMTPGFASALTRWPTIATVCTITVGAAFVGSWLDLLAGLLALGAVRLILAFLARRRVASPEAAWHAEVLRLALMSRAALCSAIYFGPWDYYLLSPDQVGYDHMPGLIVRYWDGLVPRPSFLLDTSDRLGYHLLVAIQYVVFGPSLLVPRLFNCLAGTLLVLTLVRIAEHVFGAATARVVAIWVAFFPSLMLWSCLNMRDIWIALCGAIIIRHALLLRDHFSLGSVAAISGSLFWIQYTRPYLVLILMAAVIATLTLARRQTFARDVVTAAVMGSALLALAQGFGLGREAAGWLDLDKVMAHREVLSRSTVGAAGYLGGVDLSNPVVLASFAPLGIAYFLFSPFPWQFTSALRLISLPEMIVWYACIPLIVRATRSVAREGGRGLALFLPMWLITIAFAVGSSNIGLAYRYRVQVVGFFLIFAANAYVRRREASAHVRRTLPGPHGLRPAV